MNLKKQWAFNESFPLNFSPIFIPDLRSWIVRLDTTFSCFEMPILQQNLHLFPFDRYRTEKSPIDYFQKKYTYALITSNFFFHSPNATMKILFENFWLRIKSLKWKKGAKIAPFVLPSTAMFTCFNRPKNKNARPDNSLSKPASSRTLDIERCLHSFFFFFFFSFLFFC